MKLRGTLRLAALLVAGAALSACQSQLFHTAAGQGAELDAYAYGALDPLDTKYYASDEPMRAGVRHFQAGDYGLAQRHFQAAVENTPRDAAAWVGLAASYDRLRRFDLADQAYERALALSGPTVQILNNQGYSYLLRGDLHRARERFLAAYELAPSDPTIVNNLVLLSSSAQMVERHPQAY